jgi:hypothetical protein
MYSPGQMYLEIDPSTDKDTWIRTFAHFLKSAGWTMLPIEPAFVVHTNLDSLSYHTFGGNPDNDIFWTVSYDGYCAIVGDGRPNGYDPTKCPGGQQFLSFYETDSTDPAAVHPVLMQAIRDILGAALQVQVTLEPIDATTTRVQFGVTQDGGSAFDEGVVDNQLQYITIGSALHSTATLTIGGGYILQSQPARRSFIGGTYGDRNFVELYITVDIIPGSRTEQIGIAAGRAFAGFPPDTQIAPIGTIDSYTDANVPYRTNYGFMDGVNNPTIAFANPYFVIAHNEVTSGPEWFLIAGALKLMDLRLDLGAKLPIDCATCVVMSHFSTGGIGFHTKMACGGITRLEIQGPDFGPQLGIVRYGLGASIGDPTLMVYQSARLSGPIATGIQWEEGCSAAWEPWIGFNPWNANAPSPIIGQLWDAIGLYESTPDPRSAPLFNFDGQKWRRYTKNCQLAGGVTNPSPAATLCLRTSA